METLRDLRLQSKKTVAEVATALGITEQAMYRYEKGARRISLEQILILAKMYDVSEKEVIEAQLRSCK